jgi:hypothetical protein
MASRRPRDRPAAGVCVGRERLYSARCSRHVAADRASEGKRIRDGRSLSGIGVHKRLVRAQRERPSLLAPR